MNTINNIIMEVLNSAQTGALVALVAADVILSIIAALKTHTFTFRNVGDFVLQRVGPAVVYIVVAVMSTIAGGQWPALAVTVYAGLMAAFTSATLKAISTITGIPMPAFLINKKTEMPSAKG
jgi:hypothetical protein